MHTMYIETFRTDAECWELSAEQFSALDKHMTYHLGEDWRLAPNHRLNAYLRDWLYVELTGPYEEDSGCGGDVIIRQRKVN